MSEHKEMFRIMYPRDFTEEVLSVFANSFNEDYLEAALNAGEDICRFLEKKVDFFSPDEVIKYLTHDRGLVLLEEAKARVRREKKLEDLRKRFFEISSPQFQRWIKRQCSQCPDACEDHSCRSSCKLRSPDIDALLDELKPLSEDGKEVGS